MQPHVNVMHDFQEIPPPLPALRYGTELIWGQNAILIRTSRKCFKFEE